MRSWLAVAALLPFSGCLSPSLEDGQAVVLDCFHGVAGACDERGLHQQAAIDASAAMIGIRIAQLHERDRR